MARQGYLEAYRKVAEQKRDDYRKASAGEITWKQYVAQWGI